MSIPRRLHAPETDGLARAVERRAGATLGRVGRAGRAPCGPL